MTHHRDDDSIVDRAKDAIGLDADDEDDTAEDRPAGWAGVDDALGGADQEPGSVYEAEERTDADRLDTTRPVDDR